jgi:hypothetical protein
MKSLYALLLLVLISLTARAQTLDTIIFNGDSDEHINVLILGDGYTGSNLNNGKLNTDAMSFATALLNESPYQEYANFYNFFIIKRASVQIGADHPATATDVTEPAFPVQVRNTAYNNTFDVSSIHRLLAPDAAGKTLALTDAMNLFPNFDQLIMLVNDPNYGGSGASDLAVASLEASANEIAIHEMGHSFAGLADEYYAGDVFSAEKPNMTTNTNVSTVKWKNWLSTNGIGIYPHTCPLGAASVCNADPAFDEFAQWRKPHNSCKMQFLGSDFCSVCKEAIVDVMYSFVDPFKNKIPDLTSLFSFNGSNIQFGSDLITSTPNTMTIQWYLNSNLLANRTNAKEFFTYEDFSLGGNVLELRIIDQTGLSRSYLPDAGYEFSLSWVVNKVDLCTSLETKFDYVNSFPPGSGAGQTQGDDFDWTEGSGPTPSSNTGPSGAFHENTYLYLEATGNNPNKVAIYRTECFDLTSLNRPVFRIYHHLYGQDIGSLEIKVSVNAGNTYTSEYFIQGDQGDNWKQVEIDLSNYISPYTVFQITGTTGSGPSGDIAIDLLEIIDTCPDNRTFSGVTHTGSQTFKALNKITSTGTVNLGAITYQAGTAVDLNQGFSVNPGATFNAQMGGCN